jgi:hypothetical protein
VREQECLECDLERERERERLDELAECSRLCLWVRRFDGERERERELECDVLRSEKGVVLVPGVTALMRNEEPKRGPPRPRGAPRGEAGLSHEGRSIGGVEICGCEYELVPRSGGRLGIGWWSQSMVNKRPFLVAYSSFANRMRCISFFCSSDWLTEANARNTYDLTFSGIASALIDARAGAIGNSGLEVVVSKDTLLEEMVIAGEAE